MRLHKAGGAIVLVSGCEMSLPLEGTFKKISVKGEKLRILAKSDLGVRKEYTQLCVKGEQCRSNRPGAGISLESR